MADGQKAVVDASLCTGCGVCVDSCPTQAIEMVDDVAKINPEKCNGDGVCVDVCPLQAISLK